MRWYNQNNLKRSIINNKHIYNTKDPCLCKYCISSNKCRISNKRLHLVSAASLGIHIEISASL